MKLNISTAADFEVTDLDSQKVFKFAGRLGGLEETTLRALQSSIIAIIPNAEISTVEQAEAAIIAGTLKLNETGGHSVLMSIQGGVPMLYEWEPAGHAGHEHFHLIGQPEGNSHYINFHGANYCNFTNDKGILDWDKSWWVSIKHRTLTANAQQQTLFSNGTNYLNFAAGSGNYGIYIGNSAQATVNYFPAANLWVVPEFNRVLFNYNKDTRVLEYWTGIPGGSPVLKFSAGIDNGSGIGTPMQNGKNGILSIGKSVVTGGTNWLGEENYLLAGGAPLGSTQVAELIGHVGDEWDSMSFTIPTRVNMGEGVWPAVAGTGLTGGTMVGGSASDFVLIP